MSENEVREESTPEDAGNGHASEAPPPGAEGTAEPQTVSLEEHQRALADLETARKRVDELARAYQALGKEREEFKQRLTRERERMIDVEKGNVALTLLEAVDELDLCLTAAAQDSSPLAQGVRLIRNNLLSKLTATGIERVDVVGKPFNPNVAEAADMEVTSQPEDDQKVLAEVKAGYRLKDRIIRAALVKVAKYVPPAQA